MHKNMNIMQHKKKIEIFELLNIIYKKGLQNLLNADKRRQSEVICNRYKE